MSISYNKNYINKICNDMIEKIELFDRKINILENLLDDLRLNVVNKKYIEIVKKNNLNITDNNKCVKKRTKKKTRVPFNNYVLGSSSEDLSD